MRDVVVGSITNYGWDVIKYWVNSLDSSGFDGTKVMFCYDIDFATVDELTKRDYVVITWNKNEEELRYCYNVPHTFNIVVERFFHMWYFFHQVDEKYRYIISTDVKDVVFQKNPSKWLTDNIGDKKINLSVESIKYKDESWGLNNMNKSFGSPLADHLKDNVIFNAGVMAGSFDYMIDLFLNIYFTSNASPSMFVDGGGGPDQAAFNILMSMGAYKDISKISYSEEGWAAQLGTTGPQVKSKFGGKLIEPSPIMSSDRVCTSTGEDFTIVHQYDRVPVWSDIIMKKYGG